jgi:anti-sigma factor RsiW
MTGVERDVDGNIQNPTEDPRRLAELSALADGTLEPARRAEVRAWIDASDDLRRRFEEEKRAVVWLSAARERDRAPMALRERIEASRSATARRSRGWRRSPIGVTASVAAIVAVAVVLALILPAGSPGAPSVAQAAALGALPPRLPAPEPQPNGPSRLRLAVGRLHFPNWRATIGWQAIGQRRDRLDDRSVLTVYYAKGGHTVAYSIVSGRPLPQAAGTSTTGATYFFQSFGLHGRHVVTWREGGHTCLLSAAGLSQPVLAALIAHA